MSDEDVKRVTAGYDLPGDVPVFLFVGRIMKYKGLPIILDALKKLSEHGMDYRCVFIGGGVDAPVLLQDAIDLGLTVDCRSTEEGMKTGVTAGNLPGKVIFTGAVHDREALRCWNTRADLFLFPSSYDTNGIVVREAAACGLASVLIKDSCAAEGITDDRNGFLIEENGDSMAGLLLKVGRDLKHMADVGQHAMDEIYISWEESVLAAYDRYGELLEMMESGKLEKYKKETSDYILDGTAHLVDFTGKLFRLPHDIYNGMIENVFEASDYIYERGKRIYQSREAFYADMKDASEKIREDMKRLREETRENAEKLKEETKKNVKKASRSMLDHVLEGLEMSDPFENGEDGR